MLVKGEWKITLRLITFSPLIVYVQIDPPPPVTNFLIYVNSLFSSAPLKKISNARSHFIYIYFIIYASSDFFFTDASTL